MSRSQQTNGTPQAAQNTANGASSNGTSNSQLATANSSAIAAENAENNEESGGFSFIRAVILATVGMGVFILIIFIIGLIFVLTDAEGWQPRVAVFRDLTLIVVAVQVIIIMTGLAVMLVQLARFINLLGSEVKPITRDAREALRSVRTTADFTRKQVATPLIQTQTFFAGLAVFIRELLRLSRILRRRSDDNGQS
jgi:hypothetical protein